LRPGLHLHLADRAYGRHGRRERGPRAVRPAARGTEEAGQGAGRRTPGPHRCRARRLRAAARCALRRGPRLRRRHHLPWGDARGARTRTPPRTAQPGPPPRPVRRAGGRPWRAAVARRRAGATAMSSQSRPIRIASGQGFWGDRLDAPVDQVRRGPIDFLMLDYLAEVTMSILQKQRSRDPSQGYARDFVPLMGEILPDCAEKGIRVIANAGGVNLPACRDAVLEEARKAGLGGKVKVGVVVGDDILERLPELIARGHALRNMDTGEPLETVLDRVQSANAYIGARPIVEALAQGATVVITGRSTDTALTYAPMLYAFGWAADAYDCLAA